MTEIKISDLSALAARPADGDLFVIVDVSEPLDGDKTKKITFANAVKDYADAAAATVLDVYPAVTPSCRAYNNANISINNNTTTELTFNSERWDTDEIHSTVTNTGRLTCKTAGIYSVFASVSFAANATGIRELRFLVNGSVTHGSVRLAAASSGKTNLVSTVQLSLAVNDYIEVQVFQSSGGNLNLEYDAQFSPEFGMTYLGKAS